MTVATVLIELAEKMGLLAAAAMLAVLLPPLRNRLLGVGRRIDKGAALLLGLGLSIWGAMLGFRFEGEHVNVRAIGVLIAAILGGQKAGILAGLGGGLFYVTQVDPATAPWSLAASILDGVFAGFVAKRRPEWFRGWKTFATSVAIQTVHVVLVGIALLLAGHAEKYVPAWPAHLAKLLVNAAGVTLFVLVARLAIAREEARVALVEARAAADTAALEALRQRLEPHFLFNALNALRATIRTNPVRARELVSDLADLYRYLLSHPEDAQLSDEVAHACAYLAIERARLGDERLEVRTDVAKDVAAVRVPALLLQPLVENAVRHGVAVRAGAGSVTVRARREGELVTIEVQDCCDGDRVAVSEPGAGIALETLRERLVRRYGATAKLALLEARGGTIARIELPAEKVAVSLTPGSKEAA